MATLAPFARPLYVMLKPAGALCNLACDYCYYLEKSKIATTATTWRSPKCTKTTPNT